MAWFRVLSRLREVLAKVDLVHFHDLDLLPLMSLVSLVKPVVYDVHENYPEEMLTKPYLPGWSRRCLFFVVHHGQLILSRPVRNIVTVVPNQDVTFAHPRYNLIRVPNYASAELLRRAEDNYMAREDCLVFTGSQYEENGSLLLLEITSRLRQRFPRIKVLAVDRFFDPGFYKRYQRRVRELGLQEAVTLQPNLPPQEVWRIVNRGVIGLCPHLSVRKAVLALPTKIFEYMALGIPVIATDAPNTREVIQACGGGLLADPNDLSTFVGAITDLLEDRQKAHEMGKRGQCYFAEKLTWESQMPRLVEYYSTILEKCENRLNHSGRQPMKME
jgi:glycosyltransferase involved in cell wall biosynthesis